MFREPCHPTSKPKNNSHVLIVMPWPNVKHMAIVASSWVGLSFLKYLSRTRKAYWYLSPFEKWIVKTYIIIVYAPFCLGYCVYFHFWLGLGPMGGKVRVWASNLFRYIIIYFIESLSHFVLVIYFVLFFISYLIVIRV